MGLQLGRRRDDDTLFELPESVLVRHMVALGASGSGKTVFCKAVIEEAVRHGIPSICVDPQGDLCSLLLHADPATWIEHGIDPARAAEYRDKADVVIYTPASSAGIPLCVDPIDGDLMSLRDDERVRAQTRAAQRITSLLGFDLDTDDGAAITAVVDQALGALVTAGHTPSIPALAASLADPSRYANLAKPAKVESASQRLARLDVGSRRLLFANGVPLDIDHLLGRDATALPGRVRVSVIYLNTLDAQEDKEFFLAALAERLYAWMLRSPSVEPQALFYVDEIAPFLPPVRKPACKDALQLLLKQARKYGLGCLLATQNPGDVDYKSLAQIGTWALGRVTTRQDLAKLAPALRSLADDADALVESLPGQGAGELVVLSPDALATPVPMRTRRLLSAHETFTEARIDTAMQSERARFAARVRTMTNGAPNDGARNDGARNDGAPTDGAPATEPSEVTAAVQTEAPVVATSAPSTQAVQAETQAAETQAVQAGLQTPATRAPAPTPPTTAAPSSEPLPATTPSLDALRATLTRHASRTEAELIAELGCSADALRADLTSLRAEGFAHSVERGGVTHWWSPNSGARADLDLPRKVFVVPLGVDQPAAEAIGVAHCRSGGALGLLGPREELDHVELRHRLVYRVDFEETAPAPLLRRLTGEGDELRVGSVYFHPRTLEVLTFGPRDGLAFVASPSELASEVEDLDGHVVLESAPPTSLALVEEEVRDRASVADVQQAFTARFRARAKSAALIFVPVWTLVLRADAGRGFRRLPIDGIVGKPVTWP